MTDLLEALDAAVTGAANTDVVHPAATPEQIALLTWVRDRPVESCRPPLNGNNQYQAPTPDGGKAKGRTRATTFSKILDGDSGGLTTWQNQKLVKGLALSPDLVDQARAAVTNDDTRTLTTVANTALHVGGSKLAADVGTALHTACEHYDLGNDLDGLGEPWTADVAAYAALLDTHGLTVSNIECSGYTPATDTVGTIDRLVTGDWGDTHRVFDLKFGSSAERISYAVQLAVYSRVSHLWTPEGWATAPKIDQDVAYLLHIPAGTGHGELIEVDVAAAWGYVELALKVKAARKSFKTLLATATTVEAPTTPDTDEPVKVGDVLPDVMASLDPGNVHARSAEIRDRLAAIKAAATPDELAEVVRHWPAGVAHRGPWTNDELLALEAHLHAFDGKESAHFAAPDPERTAEIAERIKAVTAVPPPLPELPVPDDGDWVEPGDVTALKSKAGGIADTHRSHYMGWISEAKRAGTSFGAVEAGRWSLRCWSVNRAALACVTGLWDDDEPDALTRAAVALTTGNDPAPTLSTGALLASLTIDQANDLANIADAFRAGDHQTAADLGTVITRATA